MVCELLAATITGMRCVLVAYRRGKVRMAGEVTLASGTPHVGIGCGVRRFECEQDRCFWRD